jgi:hypothetical protein
MLFPVLTTLLVVIHVQVWCNSGHYPRIVERVAELPRKGPPGTRCACFEEDELKRPGLRVYESCDYYSNKCNTSWMSTHVLHVSQSWDSWRSVSCLFLHCVENGDAVCFSGAASSVWSLLQSSDIDLNSHVWSIFQQYGKVRLLIITYLKQPSTGN